MMDELIKKTIMTLAWMIAETDFRSEGLGINSCDSPEMKIARETLKEWQELLK